MTLQEEEEEKNCLVLRYRMRLWRLRSSRGIFADAWAVYLISLHFVTLWIVEHDYLKKLFAVCFPYFTFLSSESARLLLVSLFLWWRSTQSVCVWLFISSFVHSNWLVFWCPWKKRIRKCSTFDRANRENDVEVKRNFGEDVIELLQMKI